MENRCATLPPVEERRISSVCMGFFATAALLIGGCSLAPEGAPEGMVSFYERNESPVALGMRVGSGVGQAWTRLETGGRGCSAVSLPWTISIGPVGPDGAVGVYNAVLSSADVADPLNSEVWVDVAEDGSVTWGEGPPAWDRGPHDCGEGD